MGRGGAGLWVRYCLLTRVRKRCTNPRLPCRQHHVRMEFTALYVSREGALGDLDLNIIQMRMKWPRLFNDDAGNVDSQCLSGTDAVCFLHFCRLPVKGLHLRLLPPSSSLRSRLGSASGATMGGQENMLTSACADLSTATSLV